MERSAGAKPVIGSKRRVNPTPARNSLAPWIARGGGCLRTLGDWAKEGKREVRVAG